jgi:hypothetical protein
MALCGEKKGGGKGGGERKECLPAGKNSCEGDGAGAGADITEGMLKKKITAGLWLLQISLTRMNSSTIIECTCLWEQG